MPILTDPPPLGAQAQVLQPWEEAHRTCGPAPTSGSYRSPYRLVLPQGITRLRDWAHVVLRHVYLPGRAREGREGWRRRRREGRQRTCARAGVLLTALPMFGVPAGTQSGSESRIGLTIETIGVPICRASLLSRDHHRTQRGSETSTRLAHECAKLRASILQARLAT